MHRQRPRKTDQGIKDYAALVKAIKEIKIDKKSEIGCQGVQYIEKNVGAPHVQPLHRS